MSTLYATFASVKCPVPGSLPGLSQFGPTPGSGAVAAIKGGVSLDRGTPTATAGYRTAPLTNQVGINKPMTTRRWPADFHQRTTG